MKFDKPPLTVAQKIALLQSRGLSIGDEAQAAHCLTHLNYYRLTGYWLPFEETHSPHRFKPGTRFEDIINVYSFDRALRLLLLDAIERIEVSLRTQWAYQLAHHAGAHSYLDPTLACSNRKHARQLGLLAQEVESSQETFVVHLRSKYTHPDMPPVWAACEVLSLGQLSRWYELLRPISLRTKIARTYGLDQQVLESFLHHLTYLRNLCAHHSRVWNREFTLLPPVPKSKPQQLATSVNRPGGRRIYNTCCFLQHLMDVVSPGHHWGERLQQLIAQHQVEVRHMGFPADWRTRPVWVAP